MDLSTITTMENMPEDSSSHAIAGWHKKTNFRLPVMSYYYRNKHPPGDGRTCLSCHVLKPHSDFAVSMFKTQTMCRHCQRQGSPGRKRLASPKATFVCWEGAELL